MKRSAESAAKTKIIMKKLVNKKIPKIM